MPLQIIEHFGLKPQIKKSIEECREYIEAAQEYLENPTEENLRHYLEEMADVQLLFTQIQQFAHWAADIYKIIFYKVNRTKRWIKYGLYTHNVWIQKHIKTIDIRYPHPSKVFSKKVGK